MPEQPAPKFTHLHVHSHYSLLDGLAKIDDLLAYTKELGMDSIALTDHGNLYGAVEFFKKAKACGVKPIIGCEIYLAFENMLDKRPNVDNKNYHLILLAKNAIGYRNLVKLVSKAQLEGFYYKPRVDEALLAKHSDGLIALSACIQGRVPRTIINGQPEQAAELAKKYQQIFGKDNFYLEIQNHPNLKGQSLANDTLIDFSKKLNIPLVVTHDSHYLRPSDSDAQDILMLINTGAKPDDPERLTMTADDFSVPSANQMAEFCQSKGVPEAVSNTQLIAQQCNFEFELGQTKLPHFQTPANQSADDYIKELSQQGFGRKEKEFAKNKEEAIERLNYELSVIKSTGFASYFLIVADFVNWAKQNRIVVGPGRGSAAGSLVAYLLNITEVEPLKHGLLFERFLNPSRISMPDIDLDFTDKRRDEVIKYVAEKYGHNHVAQIITFGTMAARAVIRDVGRALDVPYTYCDTVAKMIPFGHTLNDCMDKVAEFRQLYNTDEQARTLIDLAKKLEGCCRHASTHACGVVISKDPLDELVPLQHPTQKAEEIVTQYEMHAIEDLGLLKMDFLGLKNLTIIEDTLKRIYKVRGQSFDMASIPENDKKTYKLLQKGQSTSVFQLESSGMKRYLKELKPSSLDDIIAMVALYRPGPMELIPEYIARKHGQKAVEYIHPSLKEILKPTYGLPVFQEQVMQIARTLAGFSLAEADVLRKAIGKKIKTLLDAQREKFIEGCIKNKVPQKIAEQVFAWVEPHASYSFNKCLTGDVEVFSPTGRLRTIEELYQASKKRRAFREVGKFVISLNNKLKLQAGEISHVHFNGLKPVYEIVTTSGRKIKATAEHRFFTDSSWQTLKSLKTGGFIALAREWPTNQLAKTSWPDYKVALLGCVLSEGNTCHPSGFYLFTNNPEEMREFRRLIEKFKNTKATVKKCKEKDSFKYIIYAGRINRKNQAEAVQWIMDDLGLRYKKATEKTIPDQAFRLSNKKIGQLLGAMWNGDGCISPKYPAIYYATSSEKMAEQVQNLLLRLGIISKLHKKLFNYRKEKKVGWTVNLSRYDNILKFAENIGPYLIAKRKKDLRQLLVSHHYLENDYQNKLFARGTFDILPASTTLLKIKTACQSAGLSFKTVARWAEVAERLFSFDKRKVGFQRETVAKIAKTVESSSLAEFADSAIFWDKIKTIKYLGKEKTYDLTVKENHSFVANGFIVHNSHAAAYATIAYQTAYLKAHFPVEFMSSVLTSEKNDIERLAFLIDDCKEMDIEVLQPDVNESFHNFSVVPKENKIRFGLLAVKNVGENIVSAIIQERKQNGPYQSFSDFASRIDSKDFNKKSLEALLKTGTFDKFEERGCLLANLESILSFNREIRKNKSNGQVSLFSGMAIAPPSLKLAPSPEATTKEKLLWEKELLGLYVSEHPLQSVKALLQSKALPLKELQENSFYQSIKVGGIISSVKKILTKKGQAMAFCRLEDFSGKTEIVVFPSILQANQDIFQENKIVFISGRVDTSRDNTPKIIAEEVEEIIEA